ncbi:DUF5956 family protein [Arthrobacter sp. NPDC058097]|uniref:DUF5956 family protein n=1 Tax=Arthrobacter sp. NPDC058097 TaxID=3346340 RepID=UPI0036DF24EE
MELPENGWGALMGWAAGKENVRRRPASDAGRTLTGYTEHAGQQQRFEGPFTSADRQHVDDDIDTYLRGAGVPSRPRGYVWMIRVPDDHGSPETFLADVDAAIIRAANGSVDPKRLRSVFVEVLRDVYTVRR